jgi:lipoate-protein ligase A
VLGVRRRAPLSPVTSDWLLADRSGEPEELVAKLPDPRGRRLACICLPRSPALVLGSAQAASDADTARLDAAGVGLVRRRSGGGAVFVAPAGQVWLDVHLPADDPLLDADVGRSAWWLGERWVEALVAAGAGTPSHYEVHRGAMQTSRWSRVACFAGLGPGEVTVDGRKLVGISQRRDRRGAWLHSMALVDLEPVGFAALLSLDPGDRNLLVHELERTVATVMAGGERLQESLRETFG